MTAQALFKVANTVSLLAWLLLIVLGRKRMVPELVTGIIVPILLVRLVRRVAVHPSWRVAWRLQYVGWCRRAVLQSVAAASRMGALPGFRSFHWELGSA